MQELLQDFENNLDTILQTNNKFPMKILGYGEISTVFSIPFEALDKKAFKRLPVFKTIKEANEYELLYKKYNSLLKERGIEVPPYEAYSVKTKSGIYACYLEQSILQPQSIGNAILRNHSLEEIRILFRIVCKEAWKALKKEDHSMTSLGLDAQISNWSVRDYTSGNSVISENTKLYFIDTSTPLIRENGCELLKAEMLLQSAPLPIRPLLKAFFLQGVLDRYYEMRLILIDLIANLFKEQVRDFIPGCLEEVNNFLHEIGKGDFQPISYSEVEKYYESDRFIWKLFLGARKADRFIQNRIFGRRYEFLLPGNIKR